MPEQEMYTLQEVADLLHVHYNTIYRKVKSGDIEAVQFGVQWRVPRAEIERLLSEGRPQKKSD